MAIRIKVAQSAKELRDVYQLRYQVYVEGEGSFKNWPTRSIIDEFDSIPNMVNIIAYDEETATPVGTIRVNMDSEISLPSDELYDFSEHRNQVKKQRENDGLSAPIFASAGMLAIAKPWRNRRDVFLALFKMSAAIANTWQVTNVVATVNSGTASIYKRLGFKILSEQIWSATIGEYILPVCQEFSAYYKWAFGAFSENNELISKFSGCFEYLLLSGSTTIFRENMPGTEAYLISKGQIVINKSITDDSNGDVFTLATLSRGALFGELSLIDEQLRSASAKTLGNTELIVLNRQIFWQKIEQDPVYLKSLLKILCERLRQIDERAFIYAHGNATDRLQFFINKIINESKRDNKTNSVKTTIPELASMAGITENEAYSYLNKLQKNKEIEINNDQIILLVSSC